MAANIIKILAFLAGIFLILSGMTFILWMPPANTDKIHQAVYFAQHRMENMVYVFSVFMSSILFLPVIILLTVQYYKKRPVSSVFAGSTFALAVIFQTVATLSSLARWTYAIPEAAKGDPLALKFLDSFQSLYLSIDIPGAILFYISGIIYAILFWYKNRVSSLLLAMSAILLILGGVLGSSLPSLSLIFSGGSIIIFGVAYVTIGDLTHRLFNEEN